MRFLTVFLTLLQAFIAAASFGADAITAMPGSRLAQPLFVVRYSPDRRYFVGWFDHDAPAPFGLIRLVVVRSVSDPYDIFSFVSAPRDTAAAWNPASTKCVIADAPDNGGPKTWLVYQKTPQEWASRQIEPFATIEKAFYEADPEVKVLFCPSIIEITWLSDTQVRFRGHCNTGTYLITIDTAAPEQPATIKKLTNESLDK